MFLHLKLFSLGAAGVLLNGTVNPVRAVFPPPSAEAPGWRPRADQDKIPSGQDRCTPAGPTAGWLHV